MQTVTLRTGDSIDLLKAMPESSVGVVLTDPPYGLEFQGVAWDGPQNWQVGAGFSKLGLAGSRRVPLPSFSSTSRFGAANPTCATCKGRLRGSKRCSCADPVWQPIGKRRNEENEGLPDDMTGGGYGNHLKQFEGWCVVWLVECHRVLIPGGIIKVFGAPRTYHRMARALETAGFRVEQLEAWAYSTGFPKSMNLGKAVEAEVTLGGSGSTQLRARDGREVGAVGTNGNKHRSGRNDQDEGIEAAPITTPEALRFTGYGTQMKPAWEPFIVGRKP